MKSRMRTRTRHTNHLLICFLLSPHLHLCPPPPLPPSLPPSLPPPSPFSLFLSVYVLPGERLKCVLQIQESPSYKVVPQTESSANCTRCSTSGAEQ
jgi:hypothetical protein